VINNRKKVVPNSQQEIIAKNDNQNEGEQKVELAELKKSREPEEVLYNHEKENF
jgi:hypothetical protein